MIAIKRVNPTHYKITKQSRTIAIFPSAPADDADLLRHAAAVLAEAR